MKYTDAMDIIGGLSQPSKMPWYGWSISAYDCITGSKLREVPGSVCSKCYAVRGNYCFKVVRQAHQRRKECLEDPRFVEAFILVLTMLHKRTRATYVRDGATVKENRFRWHDSGDLQSLQHLEIINEIAMATPFLDHWLPSKEHGIVNEYLKKHGSFAPNLTVRMSAVMIGETFKHRPMGLPFSAVNVTTGLNQCPAYEQDGQCKDCRQCWEQDVDVSYNLH